MAGLLPVGIREDESANRFKIGIGLPDRQAMLAPLHCTAQQYTYVFAFTFTLVF